MTKALKTTEEDEREVAAGKEITVDAAVGALLSAPDGIFMLKKK